MPCHAVRQVSVEFAVNDVNLAIRSPARLGLERLLRLLLEYENAPAVVMLNHYAWMPPAGANTSDYVINGENESNLIGGAAVRGGTGRPSGGGSA